MPSRNVLIPEGLSPRLFFRRVRSGNTPEDDAVSHGHTAEAHNPVDPSGYLSGGVKPLDRRYAKAGDLRVLVNHQSPHRVVDAGP